MYVNNLAGYISSPHNTHESGRGKHLNFYAAATVLTIFKHFFILKFEQRQFVTVKIPCPQGSNHPHSMSVVKVLISMVGCAIFYQAYTFCNVTSFLSNTEKESQRILQKQSLLTCPACYIARSFAFTQVSGKNLLYDIYPKTVLCINWLLRFM